MEFGNWMEARDWDKVYAYVDKLNKEDQPFTNSEKEDVEELSFCVWLLLDTMGMYPEFNEHFYPNLEKLLLKAYRHLRITYPNDNDLQCLLGYMISLFPENFAGLGESYTEVQKIGDALLKGALQREPNNPFVKVLCADEKSDRNDIFMAIDYIKEHFKNCRELSSYFQRVLLA